MKRALHTTIQFIITAVILGMAGAIYQGCKKVDNYYEEVVNSPQVSTRVDLDLTIKSKYANGGYKPAYAVGDTVTWMGRFFLNAGLPLIHIGDADAAIVYSDTFTPAVTTASALNEIVRFVITEQMGIGLDRPVSISANGITVVAPDITIDRFIALEGRTDTTLYVDKLATWQPENPQDYYLPVEDRPNFYNGKLPWIKGASSALDNTIYFDNHLGVFRVKSNGNVEKWLSFGEALTENEQTFKLHYIINSTVDNQHTAVYVSARTTENNPDTLTNYIFRLMKIDPVTKSVITLNRTLIPRDYTNPAITAEPVQGPVNQMPVIAMQMTWSAAGSLYFANAALAKPIPELNSWKNYMKDILTHSVGYNLATYAINTLCRLDPSGNTVQVLMRSGTNTNTGLKIADAYQYRLKPDGTMLYTIPDNVPFAGLGLLYYDIKLGQPIFTKAAPQSEATMRFTSFDTDTATRYIHNGSIRLNQINLTSPVNGWTVSTTGDIISYFSHNLSQTPPSLFAAKIDANRMYCYAGTEKGLFVNRDKTTCLAAPGQDQETGPAKWVEFSEQNCSLPATQNRMLPRFISSDIQGAVYFYKFSSFNPTDQLYSPIRFYRIYPKK